MKSFTTTFGSAPATPYGRLIVQITHPRKATITRVADGANRMHECTSVVNHHGTDRKVVEEMASSTYELRPAGSAVSNDVVVTFGDDVDVSKVTVVVGMLDKDDAAEWRSPTLVWA